MIPAKADADEQATFLKDGLWPRLRQAQRLRRVVCFVDAAHFVFGAFLGFLWCLARLLVRAPRAASVQRPGGPGRGDARVDG